jgi:hypothetical protein
MSVDENVAGTSSTVAAPSPNFRMALLGGFVAMLVGAALWATVSIISGYELGLMAIAVGFIVGYAIRLFARGPNRKFGAIGAIYALLGCILGSIITLQVFIAQKYGIPYDRILANLNGADIVRDAIANFGLMDLLFYAIAIYEGFKFSSR